MPANDKSHFKCPHCHRQLAMKAPDFKRLIDCPACRQEFVLAPSGDVELPDSTDRPNQPPSASSAKPQKTAASSPPASARPSTPTQTQSSPNPVPQKSVTRSTAVEDDEVSSWLEDEPADEPETTSEKVAAEANEQAAVDEESSSDEEQSSTRPSLAGSRRLFESAGSDSAKATGSAKAAPRNKAPKLNELPLKPSGTKVPQRQETKRSGGAPAGTVQQPKKQADKTPSKQKQPGKKSTGWVRPFLIGGGVVGLLGVLIGGFMFLPMGSSTTGEAQASLVAWYSLKQLPIAGGEQTRTAIPPSPDEVFLVGVFRIDSNLVANGEANGRELKASLVDFTAEWPESKPIVARGSQYSVWNSEASMQVDPSRPFIPGELAIDTRQIEGDAQSSGSTVVALFWSCPENEVKRKNVVLRFRDFAPNRLLSDLRIEAGK